MAVFKDLQQVMALLLMEWSNPKVVEHQEISFGKGGE